MVVERKDRLIVLKTALHIVLTYAAMHLCLKSNSVCEMFVVQGDYTQYTYTRTVPKIIDFPRYNMKCSGENMILRGIVHVL